MEKKFNIPLCRPAFDESEVRAVTDVLHSGWVAHGTKNKEFEKLLRDFLHVKGVVLVNSCASALEAALVCLDITGEILMPSFTMSASANAVVRAGATPVFCDVSWESGNIDPACLEENITPRTQAIMVVHFAGQPCDMDPILAIAKKYKLKVIEDSAECIGGLYHNAPAGSFGNVSCFSFWATKNITTGEGGAIASNDEAFIARVRAFIAHGIASQTHERHGFVRPWERDSIMAGVNYRMSDIAATIGVEQMKKIENLNTIRRKKSERLIRGLVGIQGIDLPSVPEGFVSAWQMFVIKINPTIRDEFVLKLREMGIGASVHFDPPVHTQTFYKKYASRKPLSITEKLAKSVVTLPMFPGLTDEEVDYMISCIKSVMSLLVDTP
ncbi:MAG: DegT/DnrJ/EryC1/StrS family aminotransferase [Patescibacteria group bacterium]